MREDITTGNNDIVVNILSRVKLREEYPPEKIHPKFKSSSKQVFLSSSGGNFLKQFV